MYSDVVIIGAGPAGLKCAEILKDGPYSVCILEKDQFPLKKICGGGLGGLVEKEDIPPQAKLFSEQTIVINGKAHKIKVKIPRATVSRELLSDFQYCKIAQSSNIRLITGVKVKEICGSTVITDKDTFEYKWLVGADGAASVVRKHLNLETRYNMGIYYDIPVESDSFLMYLDFPLMSTAYIWEFPFENNLNTGIYYEKNLFDTKKAKSIITEYIQNKYSHTPENIKGFPIPYYFAGAEFGNIFLAGDAAGLCFRDNGEGISTALISGAEIGRKILDENYSMPELNKICRMKKRREIMYLILNKSHYLQSTLIRLYLFMRNRVSRTLF